MTISYAKVGEYARYQVRVNRHGKQYTKAFSCRDGKRKALRAAKAYEAALIAELAAEPLLGGGRQRQKQDDFPVEIQTDRIRGLPCAVCYFRSESGVWRRVTRSVAKYGESGAVELAVKEAKKRHCPARRFRKRKMPSKAKVAKKLAEQSRDG